jgi:hypothetical protein
MEITKDEYFKFKAEKLKRSEIAAKFEIPEWKLKKIIAKEGWGTTRPKIQNLEAFMLENEADYYWAGFIAADGNISDNNDLYVCLHHDDKNHLCKLLDFLKSNHAISENTEKYNRAQIGLRLSEKTIDTLKTKFNVVPRKSLVYELPNISSSNNFKHFIRGYFDGDGCICESFSNKNSITSSLYATITGSNSFISSLSVELPYKGSIQVKTSVSTIKYNTNSAKQFLSFIYQDATIYLDRKMQLYRRIVENNERTVR